MKKAVVLILAILTTLAFSPFLFSTPDAPQQNTDTSEENSTTTTSTDSQ